MKTIIVFDIDGTLANHEHRIDLYKNREWNLVNEVAKTDPPNKEIIYLYNYIASDVNNYVVITTARCETTKYMTQKWLADNGIGYDEIMFRKKNDAREDFEIKYDMLQEIKKKYGAKPFIVFEDRKQCVDMWRENDVFCLQLKEF